MKDTNRRELIKYIEDSWDELSVSIPGDNETHLGLPNSFVAPSVHRTEDFVFREQFYWDTYFTNQALIKSGRKELAKGMVDNLLHLQEKLGYIPNSNNRVHLGRSQPPLLSSMVMDIYEVYKNKTWLKRAYFLIKQEYSNVWTSSSYPHERMTSSGLSRYYSESKTHQGAEEESGWDYTTRFDSRALDYLPVDLNAFLYFYEKNLSGIASELGLEQESIDWAMRSDERMRKMNEIMWDEKEGMYFDYDYVNQQKSSVESLATFVPVYCGLTTNEQTKSIVMNLSKFETPHGLTTSNKNDVKIDGKQWASPNGWAPLHLLTVEGLERNGYKKEAKRIKNKWLKTVNNKFEKTGMIYEKYNVVSPDEEPAHAVYPDQVGFAWSNAVTYLFLK